MDAIKGLIIFAAGAGIGAFVAWKVAQKKFNEDFEKEMESVKRVYSERANNKKTKGPVKKEGHEEKEKLVTLVKEFGYSEVKKDESPKEDNDIYIIDDDEFVTGAPEYEKVTITHYADGYFTDEQDIFIEGEALVGAHTLDDIADGFDGVVYVRNEYLSTDYEVLFTTELYSERLKED